MEWIDTHTHLFAEEFQDDLNQVIARAHQNNLQYCLLPNINEKSMNDVLMACTEFPICLPMLGLHPCEIGPKYKKELTAIEKRIDQEKIFGIGEVGIDLYWDDQYKREQLEALQIQCRWAFELDLPISIHCRNSMDLVLDLMENLPFQVKGVFHCFTGNTEQIFRIQQLNMLIGLGGVLTFKKNKSLRETVQQTDPAMVVLETDAPYLSPHPLRGRRNEPSNIPIIGECLANIWNLSLKDIAEITTRNAKTTFDLA